MMDPAEAAARAFYNAAGGSYDMPARAAEPQLAPPMQPTPEPDPIAEPDSDPAAALFAPAPTRGLVDWNEPPAEPAQFDLQAPPGVLDRSAEGQAAMMRLRDGLAAAGAGVTIARELFDDAVRAQQDRRWIVPQERAEAELRQHFGSRYDAQIGAAQALVQRAAARCPEIIPFLENTGLGNSPEFIRKLAAAAGKRRGG